MRPLIRFSMFGLLLVTAALAMGMGNTSNRDNSGRLINGGCQISGGLSVDGGLALGGNLQLSGDAGANSATFNQLTVRGDAGVGNNLFVAGDAGINGQLTATTLQVAPAGAVITRILKNTATVDFVTATTTCTESSSITVTGALAGDACFPIVPSSGGSTNASYTCYVSASDACKVRHCAAGSADDPVSATFGCVVLSTQ